MKIFNPDKFIHYYLRIFQPPKKMKIVWIFKWEKVSFISMLGKPLSGIGQLLTLKFFEVRTKILCYPLAAAAVVMSMKKGKKYYHFKSLN